MRPIASLLVSFLLSISMNAGARAQGELGLHDQDREDLARIEAFRDAHPGGVRGPITIIEAKALRDVFPGYRFGTIRYRTSKIKAPEPFQAHNLMRVNPEGKVERLATKEDLEKFFRAQLKNVPDEAHACAVVRAWLRLAQELEQGEVRSLTFKIDDESVRASSDAAIRTARGRARVLKGGSGEIEVRIRFDDGHLSEIKPTSTVKPTGDAPT
jgi:hypothetical protein